MPNTPYGISKLVAEKIHQTWQAGQLTIVRPGVVFGRGENGNFTRLYWGIRGHKFMYPGRKDTIKACIYVKELVRFMLYRLEHHDSGVELYNCCYEPAYTIEHIVESMKRVTNMKVKGMADHDCCWYSRSARLSDGHLSGTGEKAADLYEYLRKKTVRFGLPFPLHL